MLTQGLSPTRFGETTALADGYAELVPAVVPPPDLFQRLAAISRRGLEEMFLERYQTVSGEQVDPDDVVFFPTASLAIATVARYLAGSGARRVGVPEPVFDNLPRLLRDAGLELVPVPERDEAVLEAVATLDALFLVLPNNPTGWTPSVRTLKALPAAAKASGCRVVIDRTCRFHQDRQYSWLLDADFEWIDIEDTGKTWSTAGTKIAFVRARSSRAVAAIHEGLDTHMKDVAPLNLYVTAEAIRVENGTRRVRGVIERNREVLLNAVDELGFTLVSRPLGVALLRLPHGCRLDSAQLVDKLQASGVEIMPGRAFFWNSPERGESLVRVSLVRPPETYPARIRALVEAIRACT